ncbi:MAG: IS21 family transposase [Anaerolineaceae bacterium]|nr:IS21 family transposase [Anaerolineaceae bacterium]
MSQERLSMRKIREVLRLKASGLSQRAIARSCSISHSTVSEYLQRAEAIGLSWPLPDDLGEEELFRRLLPPPARSSSRAIPSPDWSVIHTELRRKSVTLQLLWVEYREAHPDGYAYSQFCDLYRQWAKRLKPSMRLTHKGGEKVFVDYSGQLLPIVNPDTGEIRQAQIFVAALGASSYTYAEAHWHQDLPNWISAHVRMLAFFGGVPEIIVPDNLKAGVKHACFYEPDLNPTYQDLAEWYGIAVIPARPRKPKDKAKVEVGVQVVERWILARLRNHIFFSLTSANQAIRELLDDLNRRPMRHLDHSRRELFETLDQPVLKPLPQQPYEFALVKDVHVNIDYHVELDRHYYSVPHTLSRKPVRIRATEKTVEIFYQRKRVASHLRSNIPGRHTTLAEHMPPAHQKYQERSPERFIHWAQNIGPHTTLLIQAVLDSRQHPQQAFRSCLGILNLTKRYGVERLEAACRRALPADILSYKGIKNILDAKFDQIEPDESIIVIPTGHANIRGQAYYH